MKRITQFAFVLAIAFIVGCGGDTQTANNNNSQSNDGNVIDRISNRTNIDDDLNNNPRASRQREGSAPKELAEPEGSETVANADPSAFDSALFPNVDGLVDAGDGDIAAAGDGFGGAIFPNGDTPETSDETADDSEEEVADNNTGRGALGLVDGGGGPDGGRGNFPPGRGEQGSDRGAPKSNVASNSQDSDDEMEDSTEAEDEPLSLLAEAKRHFLKHEEEKGINLLYAHHLVDDEARSNYSLNWYQGLKEPRLLLRMGVGIVYKEPRDFDGRLPVIGDPGDPDEGVSRDQSNDRGGRRGGRRDSPGPVGIGGSGRSSGSRVYKNVDTARPDGYLLYYTGDFGESLIRELDKRRNGDTAAFGQMLKDVMEVELPKEEEEKLASNRPSNRGGAAGASLSITGLADGGRGRGGRGASDDDDEEEDTSVLDAALGRSTAQKPDDTEFSGSIRPGVMLLGVGSKKDIIERAKVANVDTLITFNVKVITSRRGNPPTNTTSLKILDLKTENEQLFSSKSLKDEMVQEKLDDGDDLVQKEIDKAFKTIDEQFTAAPLPSAINEENVKKRIGRLLKTNVDNPLPAAVEIVAFHDKKLLSDDLAKTAISRLFKTDDAHCLIGGDSSQRLEFLAQWLPDGIVR